MCVAKLRGRRGASRKIGVDEVVKVLEI